MGARIDVEEIHQKLFERFSGKIVTFVDACQDGQSFQHVDIILYSKRFSITGAIGLINKRLIEKYDHLKQSMALMTSFPVNILAQMCINDEILNRFSEIKLCTFYEKKTRSFPY